MFGRKYIIVQEERSVFVMNEYTIWVIIIYVVVTLGILCLGVFALNSYFRDIIKFLKGK